MTREDIIRMAREADPEGCVGEPPESLFHFAALVAAAAIEQERKEFAVYAVDIARKAVKQENEACAKVCDSWSLKDSLAEDMAREIRARN